MLRLASHADELSTTKRMRCITTTMIGVTMDSILFIQIMVMILSELSVQGSALPDEMIGHYDGTSLDYSSSSQIVLFKDLNDRCYNQFVKNIIFNKTIIEFDEAYDMLGCSTTSYFRENCFSMMESQFRKSTFKECSYVQQCLLFGMNVELVFNLTSPRCLREPRPLKYSNKLESLSRLCSQTVIEAAIGRQALFYTFSKLNKTVNTLEKDAIKTFLKGKISEACKNDTRVAYEVANEMATSIPKDMEALLSMMEIKLVTHNDNEEPNIVMLCISFTILCGIALVLYLMIDHWRAVSQQSKTQREQLEIVNKVLEEHMSCFRAINKYSKDQEAQIAKIENYLQETSNERNLLKESFILQEKRLKELHAVVNNSVEEANSLSSKYEKVLATLRNVGDVLKPYENDTQNETIEETIKQLVQRTIELENSTNVLKEKYLKEKTVLKEENRKLSWENANKQQKIDDLQSLVNRLRENLEQEKSTSQQLEASLVSQTAETIRLNDALNSAEDRINELSCKCKEFQMDLEVSNKALEKIDSMLSTKISGGMKSKPHGSEWSSTTNLPTSKKSLHLEQLQWTVDRLKLADQETCTNNENTNHNQIPEEVCEMDRSQQVIQLKKDLSLFKKDIEIYTTFVQSIEDLLGYEDCKGISDKCEKLLAKLHQKISLMQSQQYLLEEKDQIIVEQQKEMENYRNESRTIGSLNTQTTEQNEHRLMNLEDELHNISTENMKILKNNKELEDMKTKLEAEVEQLKKELNRVIPMQEQHSSFIKVLEDKLEASINEKDKLQQSVDLYEQQLEELKNKNEKLLNDLNSHEMYILALEKDAKMDTKDYKIMKEQFFTMQHTNELLKKDIYLTNQQYLKIVSHHESDLIEKDREVEEAKLRISILEHRVKSLEKRCIENQIDITSLSAEKCHLQAEKTALIEENKLHKLARKLSFE